MFNFLLLRHFANGLLAEGRHTPVREWPNVSPDISLMTISHRPRVYAFEKTEHSRKVVHTSSLDGQYYGMALSIIMIDRILLSFKALSRIDTGYVVCQLL